MTKQWQLALVSNQLATEMIKFSPPLLVELEAADPGSPGKAGATARSSQMGLQRLSLSLHQGHVCPCTELQCVGAALSSDLRSIIF